MTGDGEKAVLRLGVDLGGTSSRIVVLDGDGNRVGERTVGTRSFAGAGREGAVTALVDEILGLIGDRRVSGVGIGASGPIDSSGVIRNPDTLPEFSDLAITGLVSERLGVPCVIESDAVTFALGELRLGAARGARSVVAVTLGTGIGVGVVVDGQVHRGADGLHPEGGHLPTPGPSPCYCGLAHCWEQKASRTALERLVADRVGYRDVERCAREARAGNVAAADTLLEYGCAVGEGLAVLATIFRPELIVIGGGSTPYLEMFRKGIEKAFVRRGRYAISARVVASTLGVAAGAIGAATLV